MTDAIFDFWGAKSRILPIFENKFDAFPGMTHSNNAFRTCFGLCLLFSGLLLFAPTTGSAQQQRTDITVSELSYDFGRFTLKDAPSHTFVITNNGSNVLLLTAIRTTCSCAKLKWTKTPIAPGGSGQVVVTYKPTDAGAFHKEVVVQSTAPDGPLRLAIKGYVEKR